MAGGRTQFEGSVTYNGVTAPFSRLEVDTQPLYAEDQTSQIGVANTFQISGFISAATRAAFQTKITQMRQAWEVPRGDFYVTSGTGGGSNTRLFGFTVNAATDNPLASSGTYLALVEDWGPLPQNLRFYRFAAGMACNYSLTISCTAKECLPGAVVCSDILSISQTWMHAVDLNGLTTRTVSGKLLVKSEAPNADGFRQHVVPALPLWYHRVNEQFSQSENGRELYFSIVDQEEPWTLPVPLTEGQASMQVHIEPGGIVGFTLAGTFGAPASESKATILDRINALMVAKIPGITLAPGTKGFPWIDSFDFTDHIYANRIDFSVRGRLPPIDGSLDLYTAADGVLQNFTVPPPGSNGVTAIPGAYGGYGAFTSGIIAPAHVNYDACGVSSTGEEGSLSFTPSTEANTRSTAIASVNTASLGGFSEAHQTAPWLAYHEEISYEYDNGLVTFQPKRHGVDPVIQQARAPQLRIIQCGYMTRVAAVGINTRPVPPRPMLATAVAMLSSYVSPATEEVVDSQWSKWTVNWRYIMKYTKAITNSNDLPVEEMYWPPNPIRPFTAYGDLPFSTSTNLVTSV